MGQIFWFMGSLGIFDLDVKDFVFYVVECLSYIFLKKYCALLW